jgi:hypothetical protein
MCFTYGFCDGNARTVSRKYKHLYPNWRQPSRHVFTIHHSLKETCAFISPAHTGCGRDSMQNEQEVFNAVHVNLSTSTLQAVYMNQAPLRMYFGICYVRSNRIMFMYNLYKGYSHGTIIFTLFCWWLLHKTAEEPHYRRMGHHSQGME